MFSPSALVDASETGNINQVKIELENNPDQDELDRSLYFASKTGKNIEILKLLIEKGANINSKLIWSGITPLMGAVITTNKGDSTEVIKYLLKEGADPNLSTTSGYTALMLATNKVIPNLEVIRLLLNYGSEGKNLCLVEECKAEISRHNYLKYNLKSIQLQAKQNSRSTEIPKEVWEKIYLERDVNEICNNGTEDVGVLWAISELLNIPYDPSMTKEELCKLYF